jgi:hypothetical protein
MPQLSEEYQTLRKTQMKALDLVLGFGQQIRVLQETANLVEERFFDGGPGLQRLQNEFEEASEAYKSAGIRMTELENAGKKNK